MQEIIQSADAQKTAHTSDILLDIRHLRTEFGTKESPLVAVNDLSFTLRRGEVLGIVGESGSGKSITLRSLIGIVRPRGRVYGQALWKGRDLVAMSEGQLRTIRGREIAMIFQEPMASLNPLISVGVQISENLVAHTSLDKQGRLKRAVELLDMVGIPAAKARLHDYPHEFSGGMRQRVMIAIALASNPQLLLADEPTTALDVTIQDQILRLIQSLARDMDMSVILVTHDMSVVAQTCDRVAVMYGGRLCELGTTADVIRRPCHPYTKGLLRSIPRGVAPRTPLYSVPGTPPALSDLPEGCAFSGRCYLGDSTCAQTPPVMQSLEGARQVACHKLQQLPAGGDI
ncbi:MAG: ABC transporter ATP-binding protein [Brucellaceae bacterium]|jgi:oligopeptide transport system ATP-binding protein|nr:ABC transporter ATP-binding protein [Brucellaceae bacterium]